MTLQPLTDHVLIKPIKETERAGFTLPDSADVPERGEVLAVGPGERLENGSVFPLPLEVGQKVLFNKFSSDKFSIDGEDFHLVRFRELKAIIQEA